MKSLFSVAVTFLISLLGGGATIGPLPVGLPGMFVKQDAGDLMDY